jgi:hypothetical protein
VDCGWAIAIVGWPVALSSHIMLFGGAAPVPVVCHGKRVKRLSCINAKAPLATIYLGNLRLFVPHQTLLDTLMVCISCIMELLSIAFAWAISTMSPSHMTGACPVSSLFRLMSVLRPAISVMVSVVKIASHHALDM